MTLSEPNAFYFTEMPLSGRTELDLTEGKAKFEGVKFETTSYNQKGSKFHLMVLISFKETMISVGSPKIIFSKISPAIFVDSKKEGGEKCRGTDDADNFKKSKTGLFDFKLLMKPFVKKQKSKAGKGTEEIPIDNSLSGLYNYLTAPNIQGKCKDLLFILLRFSKCIQAFMEVAPIGLKVLTGLTKNKEILKELLGSITGSSVRRLYVLIKGEPTMESFQQITAVYQEVRGLTGDWVTVTLDPGSVPESHTALLVEQSLLLSYTEICLESALKEKNRDEGPKKCEIYDESISESLPVFQPIESLFRVTRESLENEMGLTVLNLDFFKTINFEQILQKNLKKITDDDIMEPKQSLKKSSKFRMNRIDVVKARATKT